MSDWTGVDVRIADDYTGQCILGTATALRETLALPNELNSNLEPANVVDGLFAVARAIENLAHAVRFEKTSREEGANNA